jgi:epoxide hydrolase
MSRGSGQRAGDSDPGRSRELPEDAVDPDQLLTNVSIYWFTGAGASAAWFLYEITHPTEWGAGQCPEGVGPVRRPSVRASDMDSDHEIDLWSEFDQGGHLAAMEVPALLIDDVRKFFRRFR